MKLLDLLEIFDTRAHDVIWRKDGDVEYASFWINDVNFVVRFEILSLKNRGFDSILLTYEKCKCVSIIFGDVDQFGIINTKATGKNKSPKMTFGAIKNLILDWSHKHNPELIIFAAKSGDGYFESRSSLYTTIATSLAKSEGLGFLEFSDEHGKYFILSNLKFTKLEMLALKKEIVRLTLSDKIGALKK